MKFKSVTTKLLAGTFALSLVVGALSIVLASEDHDTTVNQQQERQQVQLDAETKEKLQEIRDQVKAGEITREEAQAQLEELGIDIPFFKQGKRGWYNNLDEETKEKLQEIRGQVKAGEITREEAREKCEELGLQFPKKRNMNQE